MEHILAIADRIAASHSSFLALFEGATIYVSGVEGDSGIDVAS